MIDYSKELDDLQRRIDALNHKQDWGGLYDTIHEMMVGRTNQSEEAFIRETGTRAEFIAKHNGEKNENTKDEQEKSSPSTTARRTVIV